MPFRSQRQWRWAFANKKPFAKKWAHQTTGTKKAGTKQGKRRFGKLPSKAAQRRGGRKGGRKSK